MTSRIPKIIPLTAVVVIGFTITAWFVHRRDIPGASGAFQSGGAGDWMSFALTAGYGFVVTLVGVALGAAYRRLVKLGTSGTDRIKPLQLASDVINSVDFQIGLVGAPIVYGLLWQSISDIHLSGLTIIALQNGFTSHAILDQFVTGRPAQHAAGS